MDSDCQVELGFHILFWISIELFSESIASLMSKDVDENGFTVWRCLDCGHTSKLKSDLSKHVEAKHIKSAGFYCGYCSKFCPSRNALQSHVSRQHR